MTPKRCSWIFMRGTIIKNSSWACMQAAALHVRVDGSGRDQGSCVRDARTRGGSFYFINVTTCNYVSQVPTI